jgi:DHA1 family tetracycline resistance protein-like MFS transporter
MTEQPKHGRAAFAFVFVTVALDMLALGVMIPVLPELILQLSGGDRPSAVETSGVFSFAWATMQFLFSPLLGAVSDRFGRRPVILISNLGLGLDYLLMANAPTLAWLFAGRVISGITASSFSAAGAYIADVTPPAQRAAKFGQLGAAFGLGFVVGPAIGGLLGDISLRLPLWVAAGLSLTNFLYGLFVLPESLPKEQRSAFSLAKANPIGTLRLFRSERALLGLAIVAFVELLAHEVLPSIFVLYTDARYAWHEHEVGLSLALIGISSTIVSVVLVGPAVKRFGERATLLGGIALGAIGLATYAAAPTGGIFLSGTVFVALWGLASAPEQSIMSRVVGPQAQGQLQGGLSSLQGIAGMIAPLFYSRLLAAALRAEGSMHVVGAPFWTASAMLVLATVLAWRATRVIPPIDDEGATEAADRS